MYVAPTPFGLLDGVDRQVTLILLANEHIDARFRLVGDIQRIETQSGHAVHFRHEDEQPYHHRGGQPNCRDSPSVSGVPDSRTRRPPRSGLKQKPVTPTTETAIQPRRSRKIMTADLSRTSIEEMIGVSESRCDSRYKFVNRPFQSRLVVGDRVAGSDRLVRQVQEYLRHQDYRASFLLIGLLDLRSRATCFKAPRSPRSGPIRIQAGTAGSFFCRFRQTIMMSNL